MQSRRTFLVHLAHWTSASLAAVVAMVVPREASATIPRGPVLEERLMLGLRVKTASDTKFIQMIVERVEQGALPVGLVDSTYFWAREKAAKNLRLQNNPMVYFRPGLIARAGKLGIEL